MKHKIINELTKTFRILIILLSRFPLRWGFIKFYLHLLSIHLAFKNDFIIFLPGRVSIIFQSSGVVKPLHYRNFMIFSVLEMGLKISCDCFGV